MDDRELMETVKERELIYDGKVVHLEKWRVELPDGREADREIIQHVGAAAVVACDDQGRVFMVKQCRVALGRAMLEIPAGKLDSKGEDHLLAAQRELKEETGLTAREWIHMTDVITTPGFCDEQIALYLAAGLTQGNSHLDEDEFLNVYRVPYKELVEKIYRKEIHDQKTVCALLLARPFLEARNLI
ncbi:MAG TPA: NUDIX hydrolase [Candidatus Excrementavichristensenella intestinipullorum]|nr:NUDIX hydrolase [Candidatus Excrementavichristensenella intestinipullorum]